MEGQRVRPRVRWRGEENESECGTLVVTLVHNYNILDMFLNLIVIHSFSLLFF